MDVEIKKLITVAVRNRMKKADGVNAEEVGAIIANFKKQAQSLKSIGLAYERLELSLENFTNTGSFSWTNSAEVEHIIAALEKVRNNYNMLLEMESSDEDQDHDDELKKQNDQATGLGVRLCFLLVEFFFLMSDGEEVIKRIETFRESLKPIKNVKMTTELMEFFQLAEKKIHLENEDQLAEFMDEYQLPNQFVEDITFEFCEQITYLERFFDEDLDPNTTETGLMVCEEAINRIQSELGAHHENLFGTDKSLMITLELMVINIWTGIDY